MMESLKVDEDQVTEPALAFLWQFKSTVPESRKDSNTSSSSSEKTEPNKSTDSSENHKGSLLNSPEKNYKSNTK